MDNTTIMLIAIGIMAIISAGIALKKRQTFRKLEKLLSQGKFDEFFELIDKPMTRVLYPEYNILYFKLNAYLLKGDMNATNAMLDLLLKRKTSGRQRSDLVVKAFNVYLSQHNRKRTRAMLEEIESWTDARLAPIQHDCRRMYDIAISKKSDYLDEMLAEAEKASGLVRGRLEYFIALQYENMGDNEHRDEFVERAKQNMFPVPGN